jgi:hypothetical protein
MDEKTRDRHDSVGAEAEQTLINGDVVNGTWPKRRRSRHRHAGFDAS